MILKKLTVAKGEGRKQLADWDNILCLVFMILVLGLALANGYFIFAYFSMGLLVARVGEIIFEVKHNLFEKPFLHCLLLMGIPAQLVWDTFLSR